LTDDSPSIAIAGNLTLDDTVTAAGSVPQAAGGDALYASLAVRAWGATPTLVTLVGDDYPRAHLARMAAAGVDTSAVRTTDGPTVHYRVTYAPDGNRTFEWVGPEERLLLTSPTETDYANLDSADWLHLAAMPIEAQEIGIAAGRARGVPISLDPHEEYVVGLEDRVRRMVDGVVFMPSELEARLLFPDIDAADPIAFGFAVAERLDAWRPVAVAVKLGRLGSVVRVDARSLHVPALPADVLDPTGAGDAYCGGFVVGWLVTGDSAVAAACGSVTAAETIGRFGAFDDGPPPTPTDRLANIDRVLAAGSHDSSTTEHKAAVRTLRAYLFGQRQASPA
jgi:sugar/nucleoside kinase (ribokinase family)